MSEVTTNATTTNATTTNAATTVTGPAVTRPNLVIGGRVTDRHGAPVTVGVHLTVALEAVVPDDVLLGDDVSDDTVYDIYGVELRTDADGRFTDTYDPADDVRALLTGWVKCTVQLQARVPDAPVRTKVVRWMRPTSEEVLAGLSALLADIGCARDCLNKK
jgi:hypothetical protein